MIYKKWITLSCLFIFLSAATLSSSEELALPAGFHASEGEPFILESAVVQHPTSTLDPAELPTGTEDNLDSRISPTPTPQLPPESWRNWPVVPTLSARAIQIIQSAVDNPALNLLAISRVGDCQFTTATFLAGYAKGDYFIPEGLEGTIHYYKESMVRDSVTAANGLGINSVLNPLFAASAGYVQCQDNETPLDCELRTRRPAIVMVSMGTNWKPHAEFTFEENLRKVVDTILASGALPILSTKADNIEEDWKLNLVNAKVAYEYGLPLVNVWLAVQSLPDNGLSAANPQYLSGNGWMARNHAWLRTLKVVQEAFMESVE